MTAPEFRWQKQSAREKDLRALIDREYAACLMNNTKWNELAAALFDLRLMFTFQFVDVAEPQVGGGFWSTDPRYWDGPFGPFLTLAIEWLEIDPVRNDPPLGHLLQPTSVDCTGEVESRLQQIGVPYHKRDGRIRVVGHVRKTTPG
jgi:hypothetical protein